MNKNIKILVFATFQAQHLITSNSIGVNYVETDGYYIVSDGKSYFITFSKSCETIHDFRNELLIHVRNNRKFFGNLIPILLTFFQSHYINSFRTQKRTQTQKSPGLIKALGS